MIVILYYQNIILYWPFWVSWMRRRKGRMRRFPAFFLSEMWSFSQWDVDFFLSEMWSFSQWDVDFFLSEMWSFSQWDVDFFLSEMWIFFLSEMWSFFLSEMWSFSQWDVCIEYTLYVLFISEDQSVWGSVILTSGTSSSRLIYTTIQIF